MSVESEAAETIVSAASDSTRQKRLAKHLLWHWRIDENDRCEHELARGCARWRNGCVQRKRGPFDGFFVY